MRVIFWDEKRQATRVIEADGITYYERDDEPSAVHIQQYERGAEYCVGVAKVYRDPDGCGEFADLIDLRRYQEPKPDVEFDADDIPW